MVSSHSYKRRISTIGLTLSAVSAMLGSGWLFSSLYVGELAGPASIFAWIIGGLLVMAVALTYAEVSTMLPLSGGSTRFPQLTHGTFVSLFFGWITWFNLMTAPAIEVQAMMQYIGSFWPSMVVPQTQGLLSHSGYALATVLMLLISVLNIYSIRLITRLNNVFCIWKIAVPILTSIVLMYLFFHKTNMTNPQFGGFFPQGWKGVFTALATGGVLFAFNGFKQSIELAGEAENPQRTILISVIGSISIALVVYLLLQISFVGALPAAQLQLGWSAIHFAGDAGPVAGLLMTLGITWLATLLYITAPIATGAAGLVYSTSAARTLYGMSANRQLPKFLQEVTENGIPAKAVIVNFVLGMTFFLPFHGWREMAEFMSSIIALSYLTGPVCCMTLRLQLPNYPRRFKLKAAPIVCFFSFYVCTLIVYWTGWQTVSKLGITLAASFMLFMIYRLFSNRPRSLNMHWTASTWMWPYLSLLTLISYYGPYGTGQHVIPFGWDFALIGLLSMVSLSLAVVFRAGQTHVQETLTRLEHEVTTGEPATVPEEVLITPGPVDAATETH